MKNIISFLGGLLFSAISVVAATTTPVEVCVDKANVVNTCGNLVFGGCHAPSFAQMPVIMPQMIDAGINTIRLDFEIENIMPKLNSPDDYRNNVGDCQNPDKWNWEPMERIVLAKKAGMTTMAIISYCPAWLSYNGKISGVPRDMGIYTDILRKIYSRYADYIDYVEFYNEPGYFFSIEGAPYTTVGRALADMYVECHKVIDDITPGKPMGGLSVVTWSDGGVGGSTNMTFFNDRRINHDNFNFYSHHVYSDYGIETSRETVTRVRKALEKFGFGDLPVWFTEWSSSINNAADSVTYTGSKAHTFVGKCLVRWMNDGLTGAHHWNLMRAIALRGSEAGEKADGHGMYAWDASTKTGYLLPKAYVFKLMSRTLGLGKGQNSVLKVEAGSVPSGIDMGAFVNSDGECSMVIVNETSADKEFCVSLKSGGTGAIEQYTVTQSDKGLTPDKLLFDSNGGTVAVTVKAMSVTGLKFVNQQ